MQGYANKRALIAEIEETAALFIKEFTVIKEADRNKLAAGVERTPLQMIAYQLGWLDLIINWDQDEAEGKKVITPAEGYEWSNLVGLYQSFYDQYENCSLAELQQLFKDKVINFAAWLNGLSDDEIFTAGSRQWASSAPFDGPVWKWVHINIITPFKSFRSTILEWKMVQQVQNPGGYLH